MQDKTEDYIDKEKEIETPAYHEEANYIIINEPQIVYH